MGNTTEQNSSAEIIRELAAIKDGTVGDIPFVVVPRTHEVKIFEQFFPPKPLVTRAEMIAHDVDGFIAYVNRFKKPHTALFAALEPKPLLRAHIDYHDPEAPQLCLHSAACAMAHSEEWKRWTAYSGMPMKQKQFGLFIEDNRKDVIEPDGATLLEIAMSLSSTRKLTFESATRLQNGTSDFTYKEEEKAGNMSMPAQIKIRIPVFRSETLGYDINARLKYEIEDRQLQIWFELERHDLVLDAAYQAVIERVHTETSIQVFRGMPASVASK